MPDRQRGVRRLAMGAVAGLAAMTALVAPAGAAPEKAADIALWRLECGHVRNADLDMFSDAGALQGKRKDLVISCYLIRHGADYMLWDAGFGAELAGRAVESPPGIVSSMKRTLVDQLAEIGVKPEQVRYLGISHMHYDHISQAPSFPGATLLLGAEDMKTMAADPKGNPLLDPARLAPWLKGDAPRIAVEGDHDVFGDGSVTMMALPGHTHGHHGLLVKLAEKGPVLLTGDLYHVADQVPLHAVPRFNLDAAKTTESQKRFAQIAKDRGATVIIQHEPGDVAKLPAFPEAAK